MRAQQRTVFGLAVALIAALLLSACYRPVGEDLEPTTVGQLPEPATGTAVPVVTEPPLETEEAPVIVPLVTEEPAEVAAAPEVSPTAEQIAATATGTDVLAVPADGQGGQAGVLIPTQTQAVAIVPTSTATPSPSPTPQPTATATPTPTLDPALGIPEGASPIPFDQPLPTFTPSEVGGGAEEAIPLGERPPEQAAPIDGQGGAADALGETPIAIAQEPTLTTNQMTATVVVYQATARAAATLGTQLPPLGQPEGVLPADGQGGVVEQQGIQEQQAVPTAAPTAAPAPQNCGSHLIAPGETLSRIAQRYGVTTQQMAQVNNIVNPDLIKAGDTLVVACPQAAAPATGQGGAATTTTTTRPNVYVVQGGDNIYRISLRFGVTMADLIAANGMTPATMNMIRVGQELIIPGGTAAAPAAAPAPTATPLPTLAPQVVPQGGTGGTAG